LVTSIPAANESAKREQRGWYMYDWANSVFASTVVTTFLGPYLTAMAKASAGPDGFVRLAGVPLEARSIWGYTVAISVMAQVLVLPALGAYADFGHRKRELLGALAYAGAFATMMLFFVKDGNWQLGASLFVAANVCFGGANVIYNSFLPEIASEEERDRVSSRGWGIGYLGGGIALALNLFVYLQADRFGLTGGEAVRYSLAFAGVWWAGFTVIPLARLRNRRPSREIPAGQTVFSVSWRQFRHTLGEIRRYPQTVRFLAAYLLYNDAVQAVITLSSQFGSDELKMTTASLTAAILMVQFVAFGGAMVFQLVAGRIGAKGAVLSALVIWTAVLIYIYAAVTSSRDFFIAAAIVALVMGGTQALSRSLYSRMIPSGREAEYFSLYEITDKGTSWLAPLTFGLALQFTRSYRLAILSLIAFFLLGLVLLTRVDVERAAREARA
jgi:UMF1 family MFS transporter